MEEVPVLYHECEEERGSGRRSVVACKPTSRRMDRGPGAVWSVRLGSRE